MLIAVPLALLLAWGMPSGGRPSRDELAQALSLSGPSRVAARDLRAIACGRRLADGHACGWQQRIDGEWRPRSGRIGIDGAGWHAVPDRR